MKSKALKVDMNEKECREWKILKSPITMQVEILNKLYDFLVKYPWSFIAIFVVWALVILFFQRVLHVHISPWIALLTLIVSVGIVLGIILILIQNNYVTPSLVAVQI